MRSWLLLLALVGCDRTPDAVEVCDGLDNDCDVGMDEGCTPAGEVDLGGA